MEISRLWVLFFRSGRGFYRSGKDLFLPGVGYSVLPEGIDLCCLLPLFRDCLLLHPGVHNEHPEAVSMLAKLTSKVW